MTETQYYITPSITPTITRTPSRTPTPATPTATFLFKFTPYKTPVPTGGGGGGGGGGSNNNGGHGTNPGPDEVPPGGVVVRGLEFYMCKVISVTPPNKTKFSPGEKIGTVTWRIKNTGNVEWNPKGLPNDEANPNIDFVYKAGESLKTYKIYDTPHDNVILPGEIVDLTIGIPNTAKAPPLPAFAPLALGNYTTRWALRLGTEYFCTDMTFSFTVE
jgi:hypothetical protein